MKAIRCGPVLGATVTGIDLGAPLDAAAASELRRLLAEHAVLFLPSQPLDTGALLAFGRALGPLTRYPFVAGMADHPDIVEVFKPADAETNFGGVWHSDTTYLDAPPAATVLAARDLPAVGGDTLFASAVAAYAALSPAMQRLLAPLRAVNSSAKADAASGRSTRTASAGAAVAQVLEATHPVVRRHPVTNKPALFVNRGHTAALVGFEAHESRELLEFLFAHISREEFVYRHRWTPGCVVAWDNCAAQHYAVNDYHGAQRRMWRVTVQAIAPSALP